MTPLEARLQTAKIGEGILDAYLRQKGWIPYKPDAEAPHPFDRLVASPDKRRLCIAEVKTKCRREAYADTGINQSHFDDYQHITRTYAIPLFLAFVDGCHGVMYGNWWADLLIPRQPDLTALCGGCAVYPWQTGGIVYFPLAAMRTIHVLTADEQQELRQRRQTGWTP